LENSKTLIAVFSKPTIGSAEIVHYYPRGFKFKPSFQSDFSLNVGLFFMPKKAKFMLDREDWRNPGKRETKNKTSRHVGLYTVSAAVV